MPTYSTPDRWDNPILQWDSETNLWRLVDDYSFTWASKGMEYRFYILAGAEYDKASVPRPLWGIARTDGPWEGPSLLHDMAYRYCQHGGTFPPGMYLVRPLGGQTWVEGHNMTRAQADELLRYAGVCAKAGQVSAFVYKTAVQLNPENWAKGF